MPKIVASRLFLLRHAHSSWAVPGQRDHERPLDERGRAEAAAAGDTLRALGIAIDRVVVSTAVRTRETLRALHPFAPNSPDERFSDDLYALGADAYLAAARDPTARSMLLVGHNPAVGDVANLLVRDGEAAALESLKRGFPTAALAVFEFAEPLASIEPGTGYLRDFVGPRSP